MKSLPECSEGQRGRDDHQLLELGELLVGHVNCFVRINVSEVQLTLSGAPNVSIVEHAETPTQAGAERGYCLKPGAVIRIAEIGNVWLAFDNLDIVDAIAANVSQVITDLLSRRGTHGKLHAKGLRPVIENIGPEFTFDDQSLLNTAFVGIRQAGLLGVLLSRPMMMVAPDYSPERTAIVGDIDVRSEVRLLSSVRSGLDQTDLLRRAVRVS